MTALAKLQDMGISARLTTEGRLKLIGLTRLPRDQAAEVIELAKRHKPEIVQALTGSAPMVPPCGWCGSVDFWTGQDGQLICRQCHPPALGANHGQVAARPPKPGQAWSPEIRWLTAWLESVHLPEQFELYGHPRTPTTITNGSRFKVDLLTELRQGPRGPRNLYGTVERDLRRLWELFGTETMGAA